MLTSELVLLELSISTSLARLSDRLMGRIPHQGEGR